MAISFQDIHDRAARAGITPATEKSREWFLQNLKNIRNISQKTLLNDDLLLQRNKPLIGRLFMFFYDAKNKKTLPFYDQFPLIVMVGPAKDGFYGLNLHYLSPRYRAIFFDRLMEFLDDSKRDEQTRLRFTYAMLQSTAKMRLFEPCFKKYLYSQVSSRVVQVLPSEWEIAMLLPTDSFVGESRSKIWRKTKEFAK